MPNWVYTKVRRNPSVDRLMLNEDGEVDFNLAVPMPQHEDGVFYANGGLGKEEEERYGTNNWYDWSIENWGVKWNACDSYFDEENIYFSTPWGFAEPYFNALAMLLDEGDELFVWSVEESHDFATVSRGSKRTGLNTIDYDSSEPGFNDVYCEVFDGLTVFEVGED